MHSIDNNHSYYVDKGWERSKNLQEKSLFALKIAGYPAFYQLSALFPFSRDDKRHE